MTIRTFLLTILIIILSQQLGKAQHTSALKGKVIDAASEAPIPYATVLLLNTNPPIGASSDEDGNFILENVPVGRYDVKVVSVGYEPAILGGILVISGKVQTVTAHLQEVVLSVNEVVVKPKEEKEKAINQMATVSAKQFTVEETNKYAGGLDDPARMVSSFAGVASNVGSNGIVIRGNAPKGLLWRMEGVPVPAPNHFGEIQGVGGGIITALSSQMLANSDFFTGAFPSEYGNALSGVFDLSMRTGNNTAREHTFQIGAVGIDASSEGPFKKGGNSSYLFNYRYSTLTLLDMVMPQDLGGIKYQDFSFKLHFPTKKAGTFSVWGLGLIDGIKSTPDDDTTTWENKYDGYKETASIHMGVGGVTHKYFFGNKTYIKTVLAGTSHLIKYEDGYLTPKKVFLTDEEIKLGNSNITLSSFINHKFSATHTNRTGFIYQRLFYDYKFKSSENYGEPVVTYVDEQGQGDLIQAFSQSSFNIGTRLQLNPGVHFQVFTVSKHWIIEPRLSAQYRIDSKQNVTFGYGLHSGLEKLNFYYSQVPNANGGTTRANANLDFSKAHHFVLGYNRMVGQNTHLRVEPYYQHLYNIPVIPDSSFSFLNLRNEWFLNDKLVNDGKGRNIGIDITLERFLNKGWYYLATASIFDSKYTGGDHVWRNSAFNKKFVGNFLIGKEWTLGSQKQNQLNVSVRYTYMGGDWFTPVDLQASIAAQETRNDFSKVLTHQAPANNLLHFTITYRKNRGKFSTLWSLQVLNVLGSQEYYGLYYDKKSNSVKDDAEAVIIPNLSYKIQF